jgi:predicted Fe-Mo cluster-binding NifX family protein
MKIAVASKSGTEIDLHFGQATSFLIYEYSNGIACKLGEVAVEKYCPSGTDAPSRHPQFGEIAAALEGCQAVVSVQIGQLPREELLNVDIIPITTTAVIDDALKLAYEVVSKVTT